MRAATTSCRMVSRWGRSKSPANKKPLVLMADRQPTGGYPKLGHVARADIGRLAQMRPGESCRFRAVSADEARAAFFAREDEIAATPQRLHPLLRALTSERLFEANLIGGVIDPLAATACESWDLNFVRISASNRTKMFHVKHFGTIDGCDRLIPSQVGHLSFR